MDKTPQGIKFLPKSLNSDVFGIKESEIFFFIPAAHRVLITPKEPFTLQPKMLSNIHYVNNTLPEADFHRINFTQL